MPKPKDRKKWPFMFSDDMKFLQKAIVFHYKNKDCFLILKRSADSFSRPNDWDLPGGNVLYGENHQESLLREIKEETGLKVEDLEPIYVTTNYNRNKKIYYLFIGYKVKATNNKVILSKEHSEYKWVSKDEFNELNLSNSGSYLVNLVKKIFL